MKDNQLEKPKPVRKISTKKPTAKPPKFNFMWFYLLIIVAFLFVANLLNSSGAKEIGYKEFAAMDRQHDVEKVTAYKNGDIIDVDVYIKKGALSKTQYADVRDQRNTVITGNAGPQYFFHYGSYDSLEKKIADSERDFTNDQRVRLDYIIKENLFSNTLFQFVIMLILVVGVW